jgi:hypothetical protein
VKTRYVSDGYHAFDELYDHRMALTAPHCAMGPKSCWRSKRHHPDWEPMFDGFFIVGLDLHDVGVVTYHYKLEHWDKFACVPEIEHAPAWDGHQPHDVVDRLIKFAIGESKNWRSTSSIASSSSVIEPSSKRSSSSGPRWLRAPVSSSPRRNERPVDHVAALDAERRRVSRRWEPGWASG